MRAWARVSDVFHSGEAFVVNLGGFPKYQKDQPKIECRLILRHDPNVPLRTQ